MIGGVGVLIVIRTLALAAPWVASPSGVVYIQLSIAYGNRNHYLGGLYIALLTRIEQ